MEKEPLKDTLTPLGRRLLNEIKAGEPGWIAPGEQYQLADPVELGFIAVEYDPDTAEDGQW